MLEMKEGTAMHGWATDLFPICRSITGDGVRETLRYFQTYCANLTVHEVPSGTPVFDWTVPDEWNVKDAYVATPDGVRLVDFQVCNLHVMGYSDAIDRIMTLRELDQFLHSIPEQPTAIPYITSYYKRRWGFCVSHDQRIELRKQPETEVRVLIDSTLRKGSLTYGELRLQGSSEQEVLLSTYVCHPSMANNELSGPCVAVALAQWLSELPRLRYSYRILFLPETIGSIAYLSQHLPELKKRVVAGFVLTCLGDDGPYSYLPSREGNTLADRAALQALQSHAPAFRSYSFLDRGSDERQYCSPGVDLPVCSVMRSKYATYPEYHTSLDDLSFISPRGLQGAFDIFRKIITSLEANRTYKSKNLCEPQLGKRGLYPTLSTKDTKQIVADVMNLLAYADGKSDLISIAKAINAPVEKLAEIAERLVVSDLLEIVSSP